MGGKLPRYLLHRSLPLLLLAALINGQETDRFIDVRKIIKGALDVMKTYPAPNTLIQPLPLIQQQPVAGAQFTQPAMAIPLPMPPAQDYRPLNYQNNMPFAANTQQYAPNYQPMQALPPQYAQTTSSIRRIFAQPTKTDMEKLFHLPADIIQRLAADAGYIDNKGDVDKESHKKYSQEGTGGAVSSANSFNFNINQGPTKLWGMNQKGEQNLCKKIGSKARKTIDKNAGIKKKPEEPSSNKVAKREGSSFSSSHSIASYLDKIPDLEQVEFDVLLTRESTTTTRAPAIVASGKPRVLMRSVNREGKIIQIPVLAIPQPNGEIAYIPFEHLSDLSDALAKLVSTGQIYVDDILPSSNTASKDEKASKSKIATSGLLSNPLIDQTSNAIATNMVPTQTMRKIFPVKDVVYPSSSAVQTSPTNQEHIMIEPPTTAASTTEASEMTTTTTSRSEEITPDAVKVTEKAKKIVMTESRAFVQEMDHSGEQFKEQKTDKINEVDGKTNTAANDEIMLNGKRYKLVGPAEDSTTPSPKTSITEMNSISNLISRMLKSQPTQVPANGEPYSLDSNQNTMSNTDQMVTFNTPRTTTPPPFRVSQQQEYPVLPQQNEFKFDNPLMPSPVNHGVNLVRKGISTVKTGDDTVKYGMNAVRHGMNLAGNSQPMVQQSHQKDAFVQQQETANAAARALAAQQQLSTVYPAYSGSSGSDQLEPFNSARSKEVMPQPNEQAFLVNNGAFRPIPLRGIQSMKKGHADDTRRKEEVFQEVDQVPIQMPFRRQYSLKELEVFYNNQKSNLNDNIKSSSEISTNQKVYPPLKQLKIGQMPSMEDFNQKKMSRLEKLRRQFAQERAIVARRTKKMFLNRANANNNQEKTSGKVTEHHCQNIRSFARQFGTLDVEFFAKNNCRFIETYHPDLQCSKVNEYLAECQKYF